MRKSRNKPAVRPSKEICDKCEFHDLCPAEIGCMDYICPVIKKKDR